MLSMDQFTCITCRVAFKDGEIQRLHYKTDWHRYNLKRKVAELPPVTSEEFQKRVLLQRNENELVLQSKVVYCNACRKSFGNPNAYDNHLNSKKHKENEKGVKDDLTSVVPNVNLAKINTLEVDEDSTDSEIEEVDSDEWEDVIDNPIDNNDCLFCPHHSSSLLKNIKHMSIAHSFFIPDIEYCSDIRGLLSYLGEKIREGYMCLWCNERGRTFHSFEAAINHMIAKGHCKMLHEGLALAEYSPYYDYTSSYPDHCNESVDVDSEVAVPELDGSDYQLVLPSGAVVGHRSLMRYYKQNFGAASSIIVSKINKLHKVLVNYHALGWTATQQEAAARKARDLHHMKRMQSKYNMKLGVQNNKMQKHFRPQVNF